MELRLIKEKGLRNLFIIVIFLATWKPILDAWRMILQQ